MSKRIKLTQGKFAIVDDDDFDKLNQYKWCAHYQSGTKSYYAVRSIRNGKQTTTIQMHRIIMNAPIGMEIDHKNHDTLNNQKSNLRLCTRSQNHMNQKIPLNKYKGVCWHKRYKKWRSRIIYQKKEIFLGYFNLKIQATEVYDKKAKELFGEFALTNFKDDEEVGRI